MEISSALMTVIWLAGAILSLGLILSFVRLVLGPSLADRVVAVDALATMAIGALVLVSIAAGSPVLLDIALAIALIVFLGTIAMAMTIERGLFK
jgi:multisubunit Na+/H+ antiporter MnhF subunit